MNTKTERRQTDRRIKRHTVWRQVQISNQIVRLFATQIDRKPDIRRKRQQRQGQTDETSNLAIV
jgi:hypothetical protein